MAVVQQNGSLAASRSKRADHPAWLLAGFWLLVFISLAVVVRRLIALVSSSPSPRRVPDLAELDSSFAAHAALTMTHIVPAAIFVVLAVAVLLPRNQSDWIERAFFGFGAITGLTAYAMSAYAIGGWIERSAVLVFDTWFLLSLSRA